jgi:hypothetical protein
VNAGSTARPLCPWRVVLLRVFYVKHRRVVIRRVDGTLAPLNPGVLHCGTGGRGGTNPDVLNVLNVLNVLDVLNGGTSGRGSTIPNALDALDYGESG